MKTAIDFYARGKQKEAKASDYDRKRIYQKERFICPECGEPVYLTGSKYSNFFSHYKKSDISTFCDRRVDGDSTESVYERVGLPLYLAKNKNDEYSLLMGFRAVPSSEIQKAQDAKVELHINDKIKYMINFERFSSEHTEYKLIDFVPLNNKKYTIKFKPDKVSILKRYWSDFSDGFSNSGALFLSNEPRGKKLRPGDSIATDTEYYWVRPQCFNIRKMEGMEFHKVGKLNLKNRKYDVFKGFFNSRITDDEFDYLMKYLRNQFKVYLSEKLPEVVPLWPPVRKTDDGYLVDRNKEYIYSKAISGNDFTKVYMYKGINSLPIEVEPNESWFKVPMNVEKVLVNIDRKYVSNGSIFTKGILEEQQYSCDIYISQKGEKLRLGTYTCVDREKIEIISTSKIDIITVRYDGLVEQIVMNNNVTLLDLKDIDKMFILKGGFLYSQIKVAELIEVTKDDISINNLNNYLSKYRYSKKVKVPLELRKKLNKYKELYPNDKVLKILNENVLPIPVVALLEEM